MADTLDCSLGRDDGPVERDSWDCWKWACVGEECAGAYGEPAMELVAAGDAR